MNVIPVPIRELSGWPLDDYEFRPATVDFAKLSKAKHLIAQRKTFEVSAVLLADETERLRDLLSSHATRADLLIEMSGLSWSLGVTDLRGLLAFQRRLFLYPEHQTTTTGDWDTAALFELAFGRPRSVVCETANDTANNTVIVQSGNLNLHVRHTGNAASPLSIDAGSPFFEVACFHSHWFLRDGYHRAYALLQAGIFAVPAVIVQAKTIEELGAAQPWFFPEEVLFSKTPPRVADFLDDNLVLSYERLPLIKTIRITVEETVTPV